MLDSLVVWPSARGGELAGGRVLLELSKVEQRYDAVLAVANALPHEREQSLTTALQEMM